jgi:peptide/nickel transport system substrate-binding protein
MSGNEPTRRRFLRGAAAASVAGVAGCAGGSDAGGDATTTTVGTEAEPESEAGTGTEATGTPTRASTDGSVRHAQVKSPLELDPVVATDRPSLQVVWQVFEGLYAYDEGTELVPKLAVDEPEVNDDATRYVVEVEADARFQNGEPVTATDVAYSFRAPVEEGTENASELEMIDAVSVVDESTVQFDLKYPFGPFRHTLAWPVVPKAEREADRAAFGTESAVGSGQFRLVEFAEGEHVTLARWDDYWDEPVANLAELEFVPIEEPTTRVTAFRTGEVDVFTQLPPKLYGTVEGMSDASIYEAPGPAYFHLAFNCREGPTADARVREAVDYTFSMDQAVENFIEPTGVRQYSPLSRPMAEAWDMPVDEWERIPHDKDLDAAKALFDEADVPDDYQWRLIVPPDDKRENIAVSVGNGLQELGFDATVTRLDWGTFLENFNTGNEDDYNMYMYGMWSRVDPDDTYYMFARTEDVLGVTQGTYYDGAEVSDWLERARRTADREERQRLYERALTRVLEDRVHLPSYNLKNNNAVKEYVRDFAAHPVESFHYVSSHNNVSVER